MRKWGSRLGNCTCQDLKTVVPDTQGNTSPSGKLDSLQIGELAGHPALLSVAIVLDGTLSQTGGIRAHPHSELSSNFKICLGKGDHTERGSCIRIRIERDNGHLMCFSIRMRPWEFCQQFTSCFKIGNRGMMDEKRETLEHIQTCVSPSVETL